MATSSQPPSNPTYGQIKASGYSNASAWRNATSGNSNTGSSLSGGSGTLTIINTDTGQIVQQGSSPSTTSNFMSQGVDYVAQRNEELANTTLPTTPTTPLTKDQEMTLQEKLNRPLQTIQASTFGGFASSQTLKEAKKALTIPDRFRTKENQDTINEAYSMSGAKDIYNKQQEKTYKQQLQKQENIQRLTQPKQNNLIDLLMPANNLPQQYQPDTKTPIMQQPFIPKKIMNPKTMAQFTNYENQTDISQQEFKQKLSQVYKNLEQETKIQNIIDMPDKRIDLMQSEIELGIYKKSTGTNIFGDEAGKAGYTLFRGLGETFDYATDSTAYMLSYFTPLRQKLSSEERFITSETERAMLSQEFKNIKNPRQALLSSYGYGGTEKLVKDIKSDFFFTKQIVESGLFLTPGAGYKVATIGSIARAKTPEEVILPLAIGAGARLLTPLVGAKATSTIAKLNKKLDQKLSKTFTSKLPVLKNVLVPSPYTNILNESTIAKSIIFGGIGIETIGVNFVPLEQKREYIRQVALFNSLVPLGYKGADIAIPEIKFIGLKGLSVAGKGASKLTKRDLSPFDTYSDKVLIDPDIYPKFKETGGGTPTFRGTEVEMLSKAQGTDDYGVGYIAKKYDIDLQELGQGAGLRSVGYKLGDDLIPDRAYYETSYADYYNYTLHPIALQNVGLKNRLFRKPANLFYDQFSFSPKKPAIAFTTAGRGSAGILNDSVPLTREAFENLEKAYGYKDLGFEFSDDVFFKNTKIPKGQKLGDFQYEKVLRKGRPIKTGDFLNAGFTEEIFDTRVYFKGSQSDDLGGFFSSRPRASLTTGEAEYVLKATSTRVKPLTKTRAFFRKLGFADAYVDVGYEYIPLNYYATKTKPMKLLNAGQDLLETAKITNDQGTLQPESPVPKGKVKTKVNDFLQPKSPTIKNKGFTTSKKGIIKTKNQPLLERGNAKGGYTDELEKVFGTKQNPISGFFEKAIYPKPAYGLIGTKEIRQPTYKTKNNVSPNYRTPKAPTYKTPRYVTPNRQLIYNTTRTPDPTSIRTPDYTSIRTPDYTPIRVPSRTTIRTPEYTPIRLPDYNPIRYPDPRTIKKPDPTPIILPNARFGVPSSGAKTKLYVSQVRVKNNSKWKTVSKPQPYNKAYNEGLEVADNTIGQSVRTIYKKTVQKFLPDDPTIKDYKFRNKKYKSKIPSNPVKIELRQFAIDTLGEKQGLSIAKYLARKKARLNTNKRFINNKGVRLI